MRAGELQDKALRLQEIAKTTMNQDHRRALMDEAFELLRQAKRLREQESKSSNVDARQIREPSGRGSRS